MSVSTEPPDIRPTSPPPIKRRALLKTMGGATAVAGSGGLAGCLDKPNETFRLSLSIETTLNEHHRFGSGAEVQLQENTSGKYTESAQYIIGKFTDDEGIKYRVNPLGYWLSRGGIISLANGEEFPTHEYLDINGNYDAAHLDPCGEVVHDSYHGPAKIGWEGALEVTPSKTSKDVLEFWYRPATISMIAPEWHPGCLPLGRTEDQETELRLPRANAFAECYTGETDQRIAQITRDLGSAETMFLIWSGPIKDLTAAVKDSTRLTYQCRNTDPRGEMIWDSQVDFTVSVNCLKIRSNPLEDMSTFQSPGGSGWRGAMVGCYRTPLGGTPCSRPHHGWDLHAPEGTPIFAAASGNITHRTQRNRAGRVAGLGHSIVLTDNASNRRYRYSHLSAREEVGYYCAGEKIGEVGSTGNAQENRPHLHIEVFENGVRIDPDQIFQRPTHVIGIIGLRRNDPRREANERRIIDYNDQAPCEPTAACLRNLGI